MKRALFFILGGNKRIPLLLFCICAAFTSALAKTTIFDKVGASDGLNWIEANDDNVGTKAYIVYDMGNGDLRILSEAFKNSSTMKPTPCKYLNTDSKGYRVFEDELGRTIKLKDDTLIVINDSFHMMDPTVPYIFFYSPRTTN